MSGDLHRDDMVSRARDTERRISALEREPMTIDLPLELFPYQDYDSTGRAIPVTWAEWTFCFWATLPICLYPGWNVTVHVFTPAATTAEVRLTNMVSGMITSGIQTVPASTDFFYTYRWLHGQPLGSGPFNPGIEVRRTSGTGVVQCYQPITPVLMTQQSINRDGGYSAAG